MLGKPPIDTEWKLDCDEQSATLKRVTPMGVAATAWVEWNHRLGIWECVGGDKRVEAESFEIALEIVWEWRFGEQHYHPLCECPGCAKKDGFDEDAVDDDAPGDDRDDEYDLMPKTAISKALTRLHWRMLR